MDFWKMYILHPRKTSIREGELCRPPGAVAAYVKFSCLNYQYRAAAKLEWKFEKSYHCLRSGMRCQHEITATKRMMLGKKGELSMYAMRLIFSTPFSTIFLIRDIKASHKIVSHSFRVVLWGRISVKQPTSI